jgi:hypothetical protein
MQQGNLIDDSAAELSGVGRGPACVLAPADDADTVDWLYSNVRGLRQAAGELSILANTHRPHFIGLSETHTKADPMKALLPKGYKVAARLDRSMRGGGVVVAAQDHLLVDVVDMKAYFKLKVAEMCGIKFGGRTYIVCYTQSSKAAIHLFEAMQSYEADHMDEDIVWMGDFNAHNPYWITSKTKLDEAGQLAQEFSEMYGYSQIVHFPTREGNTLDLIYTKIDSIAKPIIKIGTSDHSSIGIKFAAVRSVPVAPERQPILRWDLAPWNHIKGAVKRELTHWDPRTFSTVDAAVASLDGILEEIIVKYVKKTIPRSTQSHPWWDCACEKALKAKPRAWDGPTPES